MGQGVRGGQSGRFVSIAVNQPPLAPFTGQGSSGERGALA